MQRLERRRGDMYRLLGVNDTDRFNATTMPTVEMAETCMERYFQGVGPCQVPLDDMGYEQADWLPPL
jgi:hypothetical protein